MTVLDEILYNVLYLFSFIEIWYKKFLSIFETQAITEEVILLVNTQDDTKYFLNNLDEDISFDYEFGIVEKIIENKNCQYLFNEIDTNHISNLFSNSTQEALLSAEINTGEKSYSLDIAHTNYFFDKNTIFFKEHITYLMNQQHNITCVDDYSLSIVDYECNVYVVSQDECIQFSKDEDEPYQIRTYGE